MVMKLHLFIPVASKVILTRPHISLHTNRLTIFSLICCSYTLLFHHKDLKKITTLLLLLSLVSLVLRCILKCLFFSHISGFSASLLFSLFQAFFLSRPSSIVCIKIFSQHKFQLMFFSARTCICFIRTWKCSWMNSLVRKVNLFCFCFCL